MLKQDSDQQNLNKNAVDAFPVSSSSLSLADWSAEAESECSPNLSHGSGPKVVHYVHTVLPLTGDFPPPYQGICLSSGMLEALNLDIRVFLSSEASRKRLSKGLVQSP